MLTLPLRSTSLLHFPKDNKPYRPYGHYSKPKHFASMLSSVTHSPTPQSSNEPATTSLPVNTTLKSFQVAPSILLSTAEVLVQDQFSKFHKVRVLLDSASTSHFISRSCCNLLQLPKRKFNSTVSGIGHVTSPVRHKTSLSFKSLYDDSQNFHIEAFVIDKITNEIPSAPIDVSLLSHLNGIRLADKSFHIPGQIDILLGAAIFPLLLGPGKILGPAELPVALQSSLGYIVMGQINSVNALQAPQNLQTFCTSVETEESLENIMSKFWSLENIPPNSSIIKEPDDDCEIIFRDTTTRTSTGRYCVSLPFKLEPLLLGDSYNLAKRCFLNLEKRLESDPIKKQLYHDCIQDYLDQGHMSVCSSEFNDGCFLPHHCVLKPESTSTKLRVVWNASAPTSSGYSLNDTLHIGPKLHKDLTSVLFRFRLLKIALTADIRQMYRQILIAPNHRKFQKILWRFSPEENIKIFELNVVTFGVRPAPYLALRTKLQLSMDSADDYPLASKIADDDFYIDDLASSVETVEDGRNLFTDLISFFASGGFELVKWSTNNMELASFIPIDNQLNNQHISFYEDDSIKILGLKWLSSSDEFSFSVIPPSTLCTKRNMLSVLGRIFDPIGFLGPVTVFAKMLVRNMWELCLDWDDHLDESHIVCKQWKQFVDHLPHLENFRIPRHLFVSLVSTAELIGFCDASSHAYGAVVYVRSNCEVPARIALLTSKTRLAPRKNTITIPRLELCAAELLAQLLRFSIDSFSDRYSFRKIYAFSDSSVALYWITSSPNKWAVFVSRRIARIQDILPEAEWRHVRGVDNPADCLSRGMLPKNFITHPLWMAGPGWLKDEISAWPLSIFPSPGDLSLEERKPLTLSVTSARETSAIRILIDKISNYNKLLRIIVNLLRWKTFKRGTARNKISAEEMTTAETALVAFIQRSHFSQEQSAILQKKPLPPAFRKLNPFLDNGILRVGGRLAHSGLDYGQKHPILLPKSDHFVDLLIMHYHCANFHAGPSLVLSLIRQRFWILGGRNRVRFLIQKCNFCFKHHPKVTFPLMGDLPSPRVNQCKPFLHTGVDYAGPFHITFTRRRGARTQKAYICLFVCLTTKALHLELASDLSTPTFLNALKRFLSRRGPIKTLYSDCGSNFIGARAYLDELYHLIVSDDYNDELSSHLSSNRIEWMMNAPSAPHMGGLWETNVRSVKTHLHKVVGTQILSYEEFNTVLAQIEALLNSRPLCVLSSDPSEPTPLTPAHFLSQLPLGSLPSPDLTDISLNRLSRFQLLDRIVQNYWKRWHVEYLHTLQTRQKWNTESCPVQVGTVVILKRDNGPPLSWPIGIVETVFPGADGRIRVVSVRVGKTSYRRPVVKLCPLPSQ